MPHKDIDFKALSSAVGVQQVSTRARWGDPWVLNQYLWCSQATWSKAPAMPVASLQWDYGLIKEPWEQTAADRDKLATGNFFVKVEFDTLTGKRNWYGFVDLDNDQFQGLRDDGLGGTTASGTQMIGCYGLEWLLAKHQLRTSYWDDALAETVANIPFVFNKKSRFGRGNRTTAKLGPSYVFADSSVVADFWTSANIAEYLINRQTPRSDTGAIMVPFRMQAGFETKIPDWDKPVLDCEGMTTYSLLNQVIPLVRSLSWHLEVDEVPAVDEVELVVDTINAADIDLTFTGGDKKIPANTETRGLNYDRDQLTRGTVKASSVRRYDQVIAEGARKVSVATFNSAYDNSIGRGWRDADELAYNAGASGDPGYAGSALKDQEKLNRIVRSSPRFERVYSHFELLIPSVWTQVVGDGTGGLSGIPGPNFVFINSDNTQYKACWSQMFFALDLPLLKAVDYSGTKVGDGTVDESEGGDNMGPLCVFQDPTKSDRYYRAETAGLQGDSEDEPTENHQWAGTVSVKPDTRFIVVRVTGADQYAIAAADMVRLPADEDLGKNDWNYAAFTAALEDHRRISGAWPAAAPTSDVVQVKYLRSPGSEKLEEVYIVPGTIVDLGADGKPIYSSGGFIRRPVDAAEQLTAAAKIAAEYYTTVHRVVSLRTHKHVDTADVALGNLVRDVGEAGGKNRQTVNSVISEISISWPMGEHTAAHPELRLVTYAGELDAVQFDPVAPTTSIRPGSRRRPPPDRAARQSAGVVPFSDILGP